MQTMSALDASFLHVEDEASHMHIGSVGIFEGPPPPQDAILAAARAASGRLHAGPGGRPGGRPRSPVR
jgi:hypothetical protein